MNKFCEFRGARDELAGDRVEFSTSAMGDMKGGIAMSTSSMPDYQIIEPPLRREIIVPEDDEANHELLGVLIMVFVAAAWAIVWL